MSRLIISMSVLLLCTVRCGGESELPKRFKPPTQAEMEAARREAAEYYENLPSEAHPMRYIAIANDTLVPAHVDPYRKVELRWRGVQLKQSEVPGFGADGSFGITPVEPSGFIVTEIDPPIRYFALAWPGRFGVGYYDASNEILYKWNGIELTRAELPAEAETRGLILGLAAFRESSIEPPAEFARKKLGAAEHGPTPPPSRPTAAHGPSPITAHANNSQTSSERAPVRWCIAIAALMSIIILAWKRRSSARGDN